MRYFLDKGKQVMWKLGQESKQWSEKSLDLCVELVHVRGIALLDGWVLELIRISKAKVLYTNVCG